MPPINLNVYRSGRRAIICLLVLWAVLGPRKPAYAAGHFLPPEVIAPESKLECDKLYDTVLKMLSLRSREKDREEKAQRKKRGKHDPGAKAMLAFLREAVWRLKLAECNIRRMYESTELYALDHVSDKEISSTCYKPGPDPDNGRIVLNIHPNQPANFVHESTHAAQFEHGSIIFTKDGARVYGVDREDEVQAYKQEFAFDSSKVVQLPSTTQPTSFDSVNVDWLLNLADTGGVKIYASDLFAKIPIDVDSDTTDLIKAYPCNRDWQLNDHLHPLKDADHFHFKQRTENDCIPVQTTEYLTS